MKEIKKWRLSKNGNFCYIYHNGFIYATPESNVNKSGDILDKNLSFPVVAGQFDSFDEYKLFIKEIEFKFPELNSQKIHSILIQDMPIKAEGQWNVLKLSNKANTFKNGGKIKGIIDDYENEIDAIYSMEFKYFGTGKKNSPIVKVLEKDKLDHKVVIELMRANDWQGAYNKWGDMDTASRDRITKEAYNLMMEKNDFPNRTLKDGGTVKGFKYTIGGL